MPLLLAVASLAACTRFQQAAESRRERVEAALRAELELRRPPYLTRDAEGARLWKQTRRFYAAREFAPAWIEGTSARPQMDDFIAALRAARDEGLDPELYSLSPLEERRAEASRGFLTEKGFAPEEAGALDVWLTYLYMKFASDLADGVSDLAHADAAWKIEPEAFDAREHLEQALAGNRVAESLRELTPDAPEYRALRTALGEYRALADKGGWPAVPRTLKVKRGDRSLAVRALAARLAASGDYRGRVAREGEPMSFDRELQDAVRAFQRRHGLDEDGAVGSGTRAALAVPIERRIQQIELNLERWRWLPRELGDRHILVNIPAYRLEVWEDGQVPLAMRVVVGRKESPTPIFNDRMTYLVFSPYWNVPPDIARDETLPAVLKDAAFLERANMEVLDESGQIIDPSTIDLEDPARYRFRQRPGSGNSLGLVKFMFPNQYNVYLHDTPADSLFARASRSFSHGCVRVEQPEALAAYLLADQPEWTGDRIREAMHAEDEAIVRLKSKIPVYLGYWTAVAGGDGQVQFLDDVYGIDAQQTRRLAERLARMKKSAASLAQPAPARSRTTDSASVASASGK